MFNVWIDYPSVEEEVQIVKSTTSSYTYELHKVLSAEQIVYFQNLVRKVPVADSIIQYAVNLVSKTRPKSKEAPKFINDWVSWGAGPRASQYLILGAKTRAILDGRFTPDLDDVKAVVKPALRHRLVTNFTAEADGITTPDIIDQLLKSEK